MPGRGGIDYVTSSWVALDLDPVSRSDGKHLLAASSYRSSASTGLLLAAAPSRIKIRSNPPVRMSAK
jgi:hypothetical protein